MKRSAIVLLMLIALISGPTRSLIAQETLPPLPEDSGNTRLLFPGSLTVGAIDSVTTSERFIVLAVAGETLSIEINRTSGSLVPALRLLDSEEGELAHEYSTDLAGRVANLEYAIENSDWYYVIVQRDPSAPDGEGSYILEVRGTSSAIYALGSIGLPAPTTDAHILPGAGTFQMRLAEQSTYLIPMRSGQTLDLDLQGTSAASIVLRNATGDILQEATAPADETISLRQQFDQDGWASLEIAPTSASMFTIAVSVEDDTGTLVALLPSLLGDLITPTPSPTATLTTTPTTTPSPTRTPTPTLTFTPSLTPSVTFTPRYTYTPTPTMTATLTSTPSPTRTPRPTSTPVPTSSSTPSLTNINYGMTIQGVLQRNSSDSWTFSGTVGDVVTLTVDSGEFDTVVHLLDPSHSEIASNDDRGDNSLNSALYGLRLNVSGVYTIIVQSFDGVGGLYFLSLSRSTSSDVPPSESSSSETLCGGRVTTFRLGQTVVVDFNSPGALRVMTDYTLGAEGTLMQAYDNYELELLAGPDCYDGIWYWRVRVTARNIVGWVAEGDGRYRWLCPADDPECT